MHSDEACLLGTARQPALTCNASERELHLA